MPTSSTRVRPHSINGTPSNIVNFNPQTGQRLTTGQTVLDSQGRPVTQGTIFSRPNPSLTQAQPPSNAGNITNLTTPKYPSLTPASGNISDATAGTSGMSTYLDTKTLAQDDYQSQIQALDKKQGDLQTSWLSNLISPSEARKTATSSTGLNIKDYFERERQQISEIESLTKDYNGVVKARDQQIATTHDILGSNDFINNQIAQINRNAAPRLNEMSANINAKSAALQASQGMFNEAQSYINQAVQDATADSKFKVDMFSMFYQMNKDSIDRLDKNYKDVLDKKWEAVKLEYQTSVQDKREIGDLIVSNPKAGIKISDTLEEAYAKFARAGGKLVDGKGGVFSGGFRDAKTEADVRSDAVAYLDDQGLTADEAYKRLRRGYSQSDVSDDALRSILGLGTVEGGQTVGTKEQSLTSSNPDNYTQGTGFMNAVGRFLGFRI